ncbi:cupredoxin domain-containing protein [Scleromatobacter humisilvae]|uniref:Plastocyanin n=1 Tax=Scleromatobacter humisilvae TaxID=2897159 RepID=A0A9X1YFJ1_9BURK|nr:plastocyanin [Scleromatobacter humisilvae]MCK9684747.1 plastocyanin [Scleromatobacter humisilvae]
MTRTRLPLLAACSLLLAFRAHAATVTVAVHGADGQPAPNVVVQLMPAHPGAGKPPPAPVVIAQRDIHFVPYLTAVPVGTTVRFSNEDPYDHHLRSEPGGPFGNVAPAKDFEMRLAAMTGGKAASAEVKFDRPGVVVLGCHLHSSMRGHLFVSETPWVAVTDANGLATIADVPEGAADLRTWSPEQLADQPASQKQIAGASAILEATLNFTPSKPRRRHS